MQNALARIVLRTMRASAFCMWNLQFFNYFAQQCDHPFDAMYHDIRVFQYPWQCI